MNFTTSLLESWNREAKQAVMAKNLTLPKTRQEFIIEDFFLKRRKHYSIIKVIPSSHFKENNLYGFFSSPRSFNASN